VTENNVRIINDESTVTMPNKYWEKILWVVGQKSDYFQDTRDEWSPIFNAIYSQTRIDKEESAE
jgi:hypothetical protein